MTNDKLTYEEACRLFRYDPQTGKLYWKVYAGRGLSRRKPGDEAGSLKPDKTNTYRQVMVDGFSYGVHRVVFLMLYKRWPLTVDHINGNGLDNRPENLREVDRSKNAKNTKRQCNNTSGVTGVCWHEHSKRWQASIFTNNKRIMLGYFKEKSDAINARRDAEKRYGFTRRHGRVA